VLYLLYLGNEWLLGLDCCHTRDETSAEANGTGREQNIQQFREYFKDFSPTIRKVLMYVDEAHVWKVKEATPSSWVGKSGKVVLIGDAAHGTLPWVGQVSLSLPHPSPIK
jgi:salicylate hydroxylase